ARRRHLLDAVPARRDLVHAAQAPRPRRTAAGPRRRRVRSPGRRDPRERAAVRRAARHQHHRRRTVTDFADLFYRLLPGIYRQKDAPGELQKMLQIMAQPPSEIEQSIGQLYLDLFVDSCRPEFLPLIGALIGAEVDTTEPVSVQRATLATTFAFYRSKGLAVPINELVQTLST